MGGGGGTLLVAAAFPEGPSVNLEEDGAHSPLRSGHTDVQFAHALSRRHPPARRPGQVRARAVDAHPLPVVRGWGRGRPEEPARLRRASAHAQVPASHGREGFRANTARSVCKLLRGPGTLHERSRFRGVKGTAKAEKSWRVLFSFSLAALHSYVGGSCKQLPKGPL